MEVGEAFGLGEALNGVTKHRARHLFVAREQEGLFSREITISHFAEHPSDCFVHQVFGVVQQNLGDFERVIKIVSPNEIEGGENRNASLP